MPVSVYMMKYFTCISLDGPMNKFLLSVLITEALLTPLIQAACNADNNQ